VNIKESDTYDMTGKRRCSACMEVYCIGQKLMMNDPRASVLFILLDILSLCIVKGLGRVMVLASNGLEGRTMYLAANELCISQSKYETADTRGHELTEATAVCRVNQSENASRPTRLQVIFADFLRWCLWCVA
jgi:hypothetical protein